MEDKKIIDKKNIKQTNPNDDEEIVRNTADPIRDREIPDKEHARKDKTGKTRSDKAAGDHSPV